MQRPSVSRRKGTPRLVSNSGPYQEMGKRGELAHLAHRGVRDGGTLLMSVKIVTRRTVRRGRTYLVPGTTIKTLILHNL